MKIAVVVQARTGSTRLPNKVCLPILGEPLLRRMIDRVRAAGVRIKDLSIEEPDLEDVFVELTR